MATCGPVTYIIDTQEKDSSSFPKEPARNKVLDERRQSDKDGGHKLLTLIATSQSECLYNPFRIADVCGNWRQTTR